MGGRKVDQRCVNEQLGLSSSGEPWEAVEQVSESFQRMSRPRFIPNLTSPVTEGLPLGSMISNSAEPKAAEREAQILQVPHWEW